MNHFHVCSTIIGFTTQMFSPTYALYRSKALLEWASATVA